MERHYSWQIYLFAIVLFVVGIIRNAEAEDRNIRIIEVRGGQEITLTELAKKLTAANNIVLGEAHNVPAIQKIQVAIIEAVVKAAHRERAFAFAWEFTDIKDDAATQKEFQKFLAGEIDEAEFIRRIHGSDKFIGYAPILASVKELGGEFLSVNLTRAAKKPVAEKGIDAADRSIVPPDFQLGDRDYRERFEEMMTQIGLAPEKIVGQYVAQCLTDDVMAYHVLSSKRELRFIVTGDFHSNYFGGVVHRLKVRAPEEKTVSLILVNSSFWPLADPEGGLPTLLHDPKYGDIADFVVLTDQ